MSQVTLKLLSSSPYIPKRPSGHFMPVRAKRRACRRVTFRLPADRSLWTHPCLGSHNTQKAPACW